MSQHYSDPKRESEPFALPDVEVFYVDKNDIEICTACTDATINPDDKPEDHTDHVGFYWHSCFPGCLPDSDPVGPFKTEAEAVADAQEGAQEVGPPCHKTCYVTIRRDGMIMPDGFKGEHADTDDSETLARLQLAIAAIESVGYEIQFSSERPDAEDDGAPEDGYILAWSGEIKGEE